MCLIFLLYINNIILSEGTQINKSFYCKYQIQPGDSVLYYCVGKSMNIDNDKIVASVNPSYWGVGHSPPPLSDNCNFSRTEPRVDEAEVIRLKSCSILRDPFSSIGIECHSFPIQKLHAYRTNQN